MRASQRDTKILINMTPCIPTIICDALWTWTQQNNNQTITRLTSYQPKHMHKRNTKKHQLPTANATTNEPKTIAAATNLGSKSQNNSIINRDKTMRKAQAPQASNPTETPHQNLWPASNKNKTNSSRPTTKTNPTMKRLQYNQTHEARERKD